MNVIKETIIAPWEVFREQATQILNRVGFQFVEGFTPLLGVGGIHMNTIIC